MSSIWILEVYSKAQVYRCTTNAKQTWTKDPGYGKGLKGSDLPV